MEKKRFDNKKRNAPSRPRPQGERREERREDRREERVLPENYVLGRNAVRELLSSGRDIDKIYIQSGEREGSILALLGEVSARKIPVVEVDKQKMDRMACFMSHQGIIAVCAEQNYASVDDIFARAEERGEPPFIILCDGVEDPHNLGAILRSAECAGAHGVIIPKRRNVGLTPVVAKSSAGAILHIPVARVTNLARTIDELRERGVWIYCADMDGKPYHQTDLRGAVGLVLGSEGEGISRLVKEKCDFVMSIPMYGHVNSLNVSCAGAVLMFEISHQRNS